MFFVFLHLSSYCYNSIL